MTHPAAFVQLVVDDLSGDRVVIEGPEARHLLRALRAHEGDVYRATDGRGTRADLVLGARGRDRAELEVTRRRVEEPPARRAWIATACDPPRMEWLCEKAAELGAWALLPLETPHRGVRSERLRRLAQAALGQSLGAFALQIEEPSTLARLLDRTPEGRPWADRLWAEAGGPPAAQTVAGRAGDVLLLIGPPQGFTATERGLLEAQAGLQKVNLGARRLRSETAALALLTWWTLAQEASAAPR